MAGRAARDNCRVMVLDLGVSTPLRCNSSPDPRRTRPSGAVGGSIVNWYLAVLKNYAGFTGRARRTEFWMFVLFNIGISIVLEIIGMLLHTQIIGYLYGLAILVPSLAVA